MKQQLLEVKRKEIINKSKSSEKGKQRFNRRVKSSIINTVQAMNSIDMNKLFKQNILTVNLKIKGETDDYIVRVSFGGFLDILKDYISENEEQLNFRDVAKACIIGFNKDDVFVHCSCPDYKYRFNYYVTKNNYNSGEPETRPSNITNPNDTLGGGCKHILLVMNNNSWIIKVASAIVNYVKYMKKHYEKLYADIIYPAIYGKKYEEPVQLTIDDNDQLATDTDTDEIDKAIKYNQTKTQFKPGNKQGIRFASKNDQVSLEDAENTDDQL